MDEIIKQKTNLADLAVRTEGFSLVFVWQRENRIAIHPSSIDELISLLNKAKKELE